MSDAELLARWRQGETRAGEELLTNHFDALHRFFASKIDHGVDDLIQTTLLACLEKHDQFREEASFRTYLFAIARNALYDELRRITRRPVIEFSQISIEDLVTSPSSIIYREQRERLLRAALRRIPVDYQVALELFYWENMSGEEVASVLGIPANTVRSRLVRARKALEQQLQSLQECVP